MNKEKGSSTIAMIALVAVALMVGIWIGAEKDSAITDIQSTATYQKITKKKAQIVETLKLDETTEITE